jgi:hypothetical protein
MPKKKIADKEPRVPVEGGTGSSPVNAQANTARAPRASVNPVTHRHKTTVAATPAPEVAAAAAPAQAVDREQIAKLAYSYWQDRGYQGGSPEADWLRAERELGKR